MNVFRLVLCLAAVVLYTVIRPPKPTPPVATIPPPSTFGPAQKNSRISALGLQASPSTPTQTDRVRLKAAAPDQIHARSFSVRDQN